MLCHAGFLSEPLLYLSLYFKEHRSRYYGLLDAVRGEGDWEGWLEFFLEGVRKSAEAAVSTGLSFPAESRRLLRYPTSGIVHVPDRTLEPVHWIASSLRVLKSFPAPVRRAMGFNVFRAQEGKKAPSATPLKGIATPRHEIELIRSRFEMARAHHERNREHL